MIVTKQTRRSRSVRPVHIANMPSPATIKEMTAEIRKSWSPREHRSRANHVVHHVELIQVGPLRYNTAHLNE